MPITVDADALVNLLAVDLIVAGRLFSVASEIATNYASTAPDSILNESVLRIAGWRAWRNRT